MLAIKRLAGRRIGRDFPALLRASLESRQNITGSAWKRTQAPIGEARNDASNFSV
jgi:hypothetical protein